MARDAYQYRLKSEVWQAAMGYVGRTFEARSVFGFGGMGGRGNAPIEATEEEAHAESAVATEEVVYAAQVDGQPWAVKIGLTRAVRIRSRMRALSGGSPYPIILLRLWPGGPKLERFLHDEFADLRMNGEWFAPAERLIQLIGRGTIATQTRTWRYVGPGSELGPR